LRICGEAAASAASRRIPVLLLDDGMATTSVSVVPAADFETGVGDDTFNSATPPEIDDVARPLDRSFSQ